MRAHVYTSPHLVRFNERIVLAGATVDDATLADALEEVERANEGAAITVFEVITAVGVPAVRARAGGFLRDRGRARRRGWMRPT